MILVRAEFAEDAAKSFLRRMPPTNRSFNLLLPTNERIPWRLVETPLRPLRFLRESFARRETGRAFA